MPKRDRGPGFTIVTALFVCVVFALLCVLVFQSGRSKGKAEGEYAANSDTYAAHAEQEIKDRCLILDPASSAECIRRVVEATNENERSEADLVAQTDMSLWALCVLIVSVASTVFTGIGVIFVWRSLDLNRSAVRAALQAVDVARDMGKAQSRAYVDASKAHFFWGGKGRGSPRVELWIRAFGNTPAKWHQVRMHHFVIDHGEGTLDIPWHDLSDAHLVGKWSVLVAGDDRKITLHLRSHRESIVKCLTRISEAPTHEFYVFGDITYCTFFDEIFTTQFCFARVAIPDYDVSKTEHIGQAGMVTYTRSHEKPIHLVRPSCDLEAYKKMDA